MEQALNLGPAQFVAVRSEFVNTVVIDNNGRQVLAIAIGQMDGVAQLLESAYVVFPLLSLHQLGLTAAAL